MKYALIISASIIIPIYLGLLIGQAIPEKLPLQITLNEELSLNEEVDYKHKKWIKVTMKKKAYCLSSKEGYMKPMNCNV